MKHGVYASLNVKDLSEKERAFLDSIPPDADLSAELRVLRVMLLRLLGDAPLPANDLERMRGIVLLVEQVRKIVKRMRVDEESDPLVG